MSGQQGYGSVSDRMAGDHRVQRAVTHVVQLGPRVTGHAFAEMLDQVGASPEILDALFAWRRFDRKTIEAVGADRFPEPALDLVPDRNPCSRAAGLAP